MEQNKTLEVQKNERIHENKKNRLYFLSVGNLPMEAMPPEEIEILGNFPTTLTTSLSLPGIFKKKRDE
jgi:hypothetical protein